MPRRLEEHYISRDPDGYRKWKFSDGSRPANKEVMESILLGMHKQERPVVGGACAVKDRANLTPYQKLNYDTMLEPLSTDHRRLYANVCPTNGSGKGHESHASVCTVSVHTISGSHGASSRFTRLAFFLASVFRFFVF